MNIKEKYGKKQFKINIILSSFIFVLLVMVCMHGMNNKEWVFIGSGIDPQISDNEYEFTPELLDEEDQIYQVIKPARTGLSSLDIRLANQCPDRVSGTMIFQLYDGDKVMWEQSVDSRDIENWRYCTLDFAAPLKLGHTYILAVHYEDNQSGIPYYIFLDHVGLKENQELYYKDQLISGGLDLVYNYYSISFSSLIGGIICCGILLLLIWIRADGLFRKKGAGRIIQILSAGGSLWILECLSYNSNVWEMNSKALILNFFIVCGISFVLLLLFGRTFIAGSVTAGLMFVVGIINHYTLQFRGTVLLPSDIYSVGTALNVSENYKFSLDNDLLNAIIAGLFIVILLYRSNESVHKKERCIQGVAGIGMLLIVAFLCVNTKLAYKWKINVEQDRQTARSNEIGFLWNFFENVKYFILQKPEGYSEKAVEEIYNADQAVDEKQVPVEHPNIIVIMNESFTDLGYLGTIETNMEYMNNFRKLSEDTNSKTGKCVVSVFGGGTSCSEFEFLTGCSMAFLGSGNAPYQQYIHKNMDALPSYLKGDYDTYAVHAANPASWKRDTAYPLIGFDEFINSGSEEFKDASYCRYWIDDQSMVEEVKSLYRENDNPVFVFGLTIQCHGGYDYENYDADIHVSNMSKEYEDVDQYLSLLNEADEAVGSLIEDIKKSGEPTIVLMFGDHLPSLDTEFYKELTGKSSSEYSAEERMAMYETPYIVWANYDVDLKEIPDVISANFLSPYILRAAGLQLDEYFEYLYNLSLKYPVVSRTGIMDSSGELRKYSAEDECYQDIHEYEMVQYSRLKKQK